MATVIGLFHTMDDAQRAVNALIDSGFHREDISLVARDERGQMVQQNAVGDSGAAEGAGAGAVGGTVVGGALGLLVGAGLLAIPGIGPVLAAGPLAAAIGTAAATAGAGALGAGVGAATGGLMGGLIGAGVPEEHARLYHEGVEHGNVLVSVAVDSSSAASARDLLRNNGAVDLDNRGAMGVESNTGAMGGSTSSMGSGIGAMSNDTSRVGGVGIYERPSGSGPAPSRGQRDMATGSGPDYARGQRDMPADAQGPDYARGQRSFSDYEGDFRSHYSTTYGSGTRPYEDYAPAYRYGYGLADEGRMRGDRWEDIEMDARRDWERDNPNTWEDFKSTVRYAWERARGRR